jgi:hypothetical protein
LRLDRETPITVAKDRDDAEFRYSCHDIACRSSVADAS